MSYSVTFSDQSEAGPSGPIVSWSWAFGDGGTSVLENPVHVYSASGKYTVTLTITGSGSDGTSTNSLPVSVGVPIADFIADSSGLAVVFTDNSSPGPSGPITAWSWDFGDGATSVLQNPSHTYASSNTYNVTLVVTGTSPDGTATDTEPVDVIGGGTLSYHPYISTSAINKKVPSPAPVHPSTGLMISTKNNWLLGGTPYDSRKEWLFPYWRTHYFRGDTSLLPNVSMYANNNGWVGAGPFTMPMPTWMSSMPRFSSGDGNVVLVDSVTGDVWEMWHTTPPGTTPRNSGFPSNRWNCSAYRHWSTDTKTRKGYSTTFTTSDPPGTSASKIHLAAGLLVPEDFADCFSGSDPGTVIPHALRIDSFCDSNGATFPAFVHPAMGHDGKQVDGFPDGARVQLDPSINVSTWPSVNAKREPWRSGLKKILRTLQQYGGIPVDSTISPGSGDLDCCSPESIAKGVYNGTTGWKFPWDAAGYGWGYGSGIPYDLMDNFRVINWNTWTGV